MKQYIKQLAGVENMIVDFSDHNDQIVSIRENSPLNTLKRYRLGKRFNNINNGKYAALVSSINWDTKIHFDNLEKAFTKFYNIFSDNFNSCCFHYYI